MEIDRERLSWWTSLMDAAYIQGDGVLRVVIICMCAVYKYVCIAIIVLWIISIYNELMLCYGLAPLPGVRYDPLLPSVTGAHYDVEERPPGVAVYQGSTCGAGGWVSMATADNNQLSSHEVSDIIGQVHHEQLGKFMAWLHSKLSAWKQ